MIEEWKEKLKGAIVVSVTPTTPAYDVDYPRFREHLRFMIDGGIRSGVAVLLAAGGGGEGNFLSSDQWREVVKILSEEARGKVTTMVGVFDLNTRLAIEKIRYAEELGIDAVQVAPPHSARPSEAEIFAHYKLINDAVSRIGLVLYHTYWAFPEYVEFSAPLVARLADLKSVVGIKWSSRDREHFLAVLRQFRQKLAFIDFEGWTEKLGEAEGMTSFFFLPGNYDPPGAVRVANLFLSGQHDRFAEEKARAMAAREVVRAAILEEVYGPGSTEERTLGGGSAVKALMDVAGRPMGPPFPPQHNLSEEAKARIKREFGL